MTDLCINGKNIIFLAFLFNIYIYYYFFSLSFLLVKVIGRVSSTHLVGRI